ncbi:MAG: YbaB/EbfC family nucleoid-associated protein [Chlamydiales bacterium]|nr:YbaB/EbfC family nucleoid-associated protein [Chlamydiia bacterium]MCP5507587.1 YbaB/EbfC family nucleoid-associated protein [Chlamydiales bacterium]
MGTGFSKKKKQARMMQEQLAKMQEEIENLEVTGTAGNGLVEITLGGDNSMKRVKIKPECVDQDDIEGLEDLILSAYNDADKQLKKESGKGMPGMPPGMSLPPGFGF